MAPETPKGREGKGLLQAAIPGLGAAFEPVRNDIRLNLDSKDLDANHTPAERPLLLDKKLARLEAQRVLTDNGFYEAARLAKKILPGKTTAFSNPEIDLQIETPDWFLFAVSYEVQMLNGGHTEQAEVHICAKVAKNEKGSAVLDEEFARLNSLRENESRILGYNPNSDELRDGQLIPPQYGLFTSNGSLVKLSASSAEFEPVNSHDLADHELQDAIIQSQLAYAVVGGQLICTYVGEGDFAWKREDRHLVLQGCRNFRMGADDKDGPILVAHYIQDLFDNRLVPGVGTVIAHQLALLACNVVSRRDLTFAFDESNFESAVYGLLARGNLIKNDIQSAGVLLSALAQLVENRFEDDSSCSSALERIRNLGKVLLRAEAR